MSYVISKCNAVDILDMTSNEVKIGHVGCLVGHTTNSYSETLDS